MHDDPDPSAPSRADRPAGPSAHPLRAAANLMAAVGTVWIFLVMALVVADVVGRNLLDLPITGTAEFAARSVGSIVFLQLAAAVCAGRMTRSDFLLRFIGRRSAAAYKALEVFNVLIGCLLFLALAAIAWPEFQDALSSAEYFGVQGVYTVPTWPFRGLIVAGSVATALAYLACVPALLRQSAIGTSA